MKGNSFLDMNRGAGDRGFLAVSPLKNSVKRNFSLLLCCVYVDISVTVSHCNGTSRDI